MNKNLSLAEEGVGLVALGVGAAVAEKAIDNSRSRPRRSAPEQALQDYEPEHIGGGLSHETVHGVLENMGEKKASNAIDKGLYFHNIKSTGLDID